MAGLDGCGFGRGDGDVGSAAEPVEDVAHAADLGAYAAEFFFEALVAAVEVVDAVEDGFAVGDQGSEDEGGGGAQVGAHDGGGLEVGLAADGGGAAVDGDVGAHAVKLLNVHEAVLEDVFGDGGGAFGLGGEGHVLGLHVGGEAGVLFGGDVGCDERCRRSGRGRCRRRRRCGRRTLQAWR